MTTEDRIRAAAKALSEALTEGGSSYHVSASGIGVSTRDNWIQYVWEVHVEENPSRRIAP